jgi:hypothetical protein
MIKNKKLLIVSLICFIGINTSYFWDSYARVLFLPLALACFITLVIAFLLLLRQIYMVVRERFADKSRLYTTIAITVLLALIVIEPFGIIDYEKLEGKSIFSAGYKGVASCSSALKLTADHKYFVRGVCFGVEHLSGTYTVANDTIRFNSPASGRSNGYYEFGVIKMLSNPPGSHIIGELRLYRSVKDSMPLPMGVTLNELTK